jgi:hypothetical protein
MVCSLGNKCQNFGGTVAFFFRVEGAADGDSRFFRNVGMTARNIPREQNPHVYCRENPATCVYFRGVGHNDISVSVVTRLPLSQ